MFFLPHLFDIEDRKQGIDRDEVNEFNNNLMFVNDFSDKFGEYASSIMTELGLKNQRMRKNIYLCLTLLQ